MNWFAAFVRLVPRIKPCSLALSSSKKQKACHVLPSHIFESLKEVARSVPTCVHLVPYNKSIRVPLYNPVPLLRSSTIEGSPKRSASSSSPHRYILRTASFQSSFLATNKLLPYHDSSDWQKDSLGSLNFILINHLRIRCPQTSSLLAIEAVERWLRFSSIRLILAARPQPQIIRSHTVLGQGIPSFSEVSPSWIGVGELGDGQKKVLVRFFHTYFW